MLESVEPDFEGSQTYTRSLITNSTWEARDQTVDLIWPASNKVWYVLRLHLSRGMAYYNAPFLARTSSAQLSFYWPGLFKAKLHFIVRYN